MAWKCILMYFLRNLANGEIVTNAEWSNVARAIFYCDEIGYPSVQSNLLILSVCFMSVACFQNGRLHLIISKMHNTIKIGSDLDKVQYYVPYHRRKHWISITTINWRRLLDWQHTVDYNSMVKLISSQWWTLHGISAKTNRRGVKNNLKRI